MKNNKYKTIYNIITIFCFAIIIASVYLTFSHSALADKISIWQAKITGDGKYFPALTALVLMLPPLLVLFIIKKILQRSESKTSRVN